MADIARLNGVIRALEAGKPAFTSFCQADPETAIAMAAAKYDGIVYEMEHNPWDIRALRDSLQYMLNRGQITPLVPTPCPCPLLPPHLPPATSGPSFERLFGVLLLLLLRELLLRPG